MHDPLHSAIADALELLESTVAAAARNGDDVDPATLSGLRARLALAHAAAEDEIDTLAIEGLQQTLEEALAEPDAAERGHLVENLVEGLVAYSGHLLTAGRAA